MRKKKVIEYFIYAIFVEAQTSTVVKIGRAGSVRMRVSSIRTGCPFPVRMVMSWDVQSTDNGIVVERSAHELYEGCRLNGEWFSPWGSSASDSDIDGLAKNIKSIISEDVGIDDPRITIHKLGEWHGRMRQMKSTVINPGTAIPAQTSEIFTIGDVPDLPPVAVKRRRLFARC